MSNSKKSKEVILEQRVFQLLAECDKTSAFIESTKATAKKSLDLIQDVKDEYFSQYFKKILPKLDEIMFSIIDFNESLENKNILNIFGEIESCSNSYLKTPEKFENEDIANIIPTDSIEDECDKIHMDSKNINEDAKTSENEIDIPHESFPKMIYPVHKYSESDNFECIIIHIEDPWCIYVIPKEYSDEYQCLLSELHDQYDHSDIGFASKQELLNSEQNCFVVFDNVVNTWCRVVINNTLHDQTNQIEVLSVDTGRKLVTDITKVYVLKDQFISCNNYLLKVKLNMVQPFTYSKGQWSEECIEYLREFTLKKCFVMIEEVLEDSLLVHISHENIDLSVDIAVNHFAQFGDGDNEDEIDEDLKAPAVIENFQSKVNDNLSDENFGPDINVKFDNLKLNDEKILCQFYKGPPDTTCFKGNRCKKIHKLFYKDGLTVERVPIKTIKIIDLPNPGSVVNVLVTSIKSCRNIYVQLLSVTKPQNNDIDYESLQETFKNTISDMNKQKNISKMETFDYSPAIGEFVVAIFDKNKSWQRARVISKSHDSVELIFVDYGVCSEVKIEDVRKLSPEYFEFPFQAVECIIINVKEERQGKVALARSQLSDMILNKSLTAIVKYTQVATGLLEIVLLDEDNFDVAGMLNAYDLIEICSDQVKDIDENNCQVRLIPG